MVEPWPSVQPRVTIGSAASVCVRAPVYDTSTFARSPIIQLAVDEVLKEDPDSVHGLTHPETRNQMLQWMIEDAARFNPMNDVAKISPRPLLIITGDADPLIDLTGVRRLLEVAKEPKELVVVTGADHELTDPVAYETTINRVVSWFENQRPR